MIAEIFKNSDQTSAVNPHKWREYDYYIDANVRKNENVRSYLDKIGTCNNISSNLKFKYSEKATRFCKISTFILSVCTVDRSKVEILLNFVAFSEYTNFSQIAAAF